MISPGSEQPIAIPSEIADDASKKSLAEYLNYSTQSEIAPSTRPSGHEVDLPRAMMAVRELLLALGENPQRPGLQETPLRVSRAWSEMLAGQHEDPATHLERVFDESRGEIVVLRDIAFSSTCEHHLLPFMGRAHVAYLPGSTKVVGLSKLARTVEVFARRLQVQERLTAQIADAIETHLPTDGVAVVIEAEHLCMKVRGVNQPCTNMLTTAFRGVFANDNQARGEVMQMLRSSNHTQ